MRSLISILCLFLALADSSHAQQLPFQAEFGTILAGKAATPSADEGLFLAESANGDIVVAGYSRTNESGVPYRIDSDPLIARFDRRGTLVWQRFYRDLRSTVVMGLLSDPRGDFVVLGRPERMPNGGFSQRRSIELRRIGADGGLSDVVRQLGLSCVSEGYEYPESGRSGIYFEAVAESGPAEDAVCAGQRIQLVLSSDGAIRSVPAVAGYVPVQHLHDGRSLRLRTEEASRRYISDRGEEVKDTRRVRYELTIGTLDGPVRKLLELPADELLWARDFRVSSTSIFVLRDYARNGARRFGISTYLLDGQFLSALELGDGNRPQFSLATPEGGLIAVGRASESSHSRMFEISAAGELLWSQAFEAVHGIAYVNRTLLLRDGWIAVSGTTGPVSFERDEYFTQSYRRDAFLLVSGRSPGSLSTASY